MIRAMQARVNAKEPGHIAVQIQGPPMHWRNIRIRPE